MPPETEPVKPSGPVYFMRRKTGHVTPRKQIEPPKAWVEDIEGVLWADEGDKEWKPLLLPMPKKRPGSS